MASLNSSLQGKVAIISASDSGIGAQIARELSTLGAFIVINYPFPSVSKRAQDLATSLPTTSIAVEADLSTTTGSQNLMDAAVAKCGKIDILVNNAGIAVNLPFEQQTLEHWDSLLNLNCRAIFLLTQGVVPHLSPKD